MYPAFFDHVKIFECADPLASILGVNNDGALRYSYEDCVKLAGHSCPTVAGAYLMVTKGVQALYGDERPRRGEVKVTLKGRLGEGTVGVMAMVATLLTGASGEGGFHGLGGKFDRRGLLAFDPSLSYDMLFERCDTAQAVGVSYNPSCVPADPQMFSMLTQLLINEDDHELKNRFGLMWQERVKKILIDYCDDERVIKLTLR